MAIGCAVAVAILFVAWLAIPRYSGNVAVMFFAALAAAITMRLGENVLRSRFRPTGPLPPAATRR